MPLVLIEPVAQPVPWWSDDLVEMASDQERQTSDVPGADAYDDDVWVVTVVVPAVLRYAVLHGDATVLRDVTKGQFEWACVGAGHPHCPSVRALTSSVRLNMPWQDIKDLALGDPARIEPVLRARRRLASTPTSVSEQVAYVRVRDAWTIRVGELMAAGTPEDQARQMVLTGADYTRISDERRDNARARHTHGVPVRWPTLGQLAAFGGLPAILERLELPVGDATPAPSPPGTDVGQVKWTRRDKVAALAAFYADPKRPKGGVQRAYRAWRDEHPEHPPAGAFTRNDTFGRLAPLAYDAMRDPAVLDGDLSLPDDEHITRRGPRTGDALLDAIADPGGERMFTALTLCAAADWVPGKTIQNELGGTTSGVNQMLRRLVALGALEQQRDPARPSGRAQRYRLTAKGAAVITADPPRGKALPPRESELSEEGRETLDALRAIGKPATSGQVARKLGLKTHHTAKGRLDTLEKAGLVVSVKDPPGPGGRKLYRPVG